MDKLNNAGCHPCPAGTFSSVVGAIFDTAGTQHEVCRPCDIGEYSPPGSTKCSLSCPAGFGADATVPMFVNVFFMLDFTGSICEQWAKEVEAAETYCKFNSFVFIYVYRYRLVH